VIQVVGQWSCFAAPRKAGKGVCRGRCSAAAFGVANHSFRVLDLLLAVNSRARNGLLYDRGDGANDWLEPSCRSKANNLFCALNEAGDI
jgi:hypothetical protein